MLELDVQADEEWDSSRPWTDLARRAAEAAIAESAYSHLTTDRRLVELSVRLTSNEAVRDLNQRWRGKPQPTNVLSFPLADELELAAASIPGPELMLGDIVLGHGVCLNEAAEKGVPLDAHAAHLFIHGTLHLLGYDHLDDESAEDMEAREVRALERLNIANPYGVAA